MQVYLNISIYANVYVQVHLHEPLFKNVVKIVLLLETTLVCIPIMKKLSIWIILDSYLVFRF